MESSLIGGSYWASIQLITTRGGRRVLDKEQDKDIGSWLIDGSAPQRQGPNEEIRPL
jgi:hypothetical protein